MVNGVILRSTTSMVVDLGFLLEGQAEDELPERMLSCVRFQYCEFAALGVDRTTKP